MCALDFATFTVAPTVKLWPPACRTVYTGAWQKNNLFVGWIIIRLSCWLWLGNWKGKKCVWINGSFDILVNFTIHSFYVYFTCLNPIQRSQPLSICWIAGGHQSGVSWWHCSRRCCGHWKHLQFVSILFNSAWS